MVLYPLDLTLLVALLSVPDLLISSFFFFRWRKCQGPRVVDSPSGVLVRRCHVYCRTASFGTFGSHPSTITENNHSHPAFLSWTAQIVKAAAGYSQLTHTNFASKGCAPGRITYGTASKEAWGMQPSQSIVSKIPDWFLLLLMLARFTA